MDCAQLTALPGASFVRHSNALPARTVELQLGACLMSNLHGTAGSRRREGLVLTTDYLIGVDGGGSGTRAVVEHVRHGLVGAASAGPSALGQGIDQAWANVEAAVRQSFAAGCRGRGAGTATGTAIAHTAGCCSCRSGRNRAKKTSGEH